MIRRPPRSTHCISSAASDVYKRQVSTQSTWEPKGQAFTQSRKQLKGKPHLKNPLPLVAIVVTRSQVIKIKIEIRDNMKENFKKKYFLQVEFNQKNKSNS
eukprot:TRINITY_DN35816_c0_g1_i2.p3 TRINITY_DN35816_c0_g1~~TRINITY_DN35816_c0_g1_i2.p3  ORF type:complete len:100 (+),score=35.64 TRINITY_DN35816_c0_g1_i2:145-444(+)